MMPDMLTLPAQEVPVRGDHDVVVCGGGHAGIAAAVAAARLGAGTLLVERLASLGGMATGAFVSAYCDSHGGPVFDELLARMDAMGLVRHHYDPERHNPPGRYGFHGEMFKALALEMVREAGVKVLFNATVDGALTEDGAVRGVLASCKGDRIALRCRVAVDATADGDLAAAAGAQFMKGDPEDGRLQHVNFHYMLEGVDHGRLKRDMPPEEQLLRLIRQAHAEGRLRPPGGVFRPRPDTFPYHPPEGELVLSSWEIEKVDASDAQHVSETLTQCQLAALQVVRFCREHLPGCEQARIGRLPEMLGTRESRRILGRYVLTKDDVLAGRKFDDGIARAWFFCDLHDSPPGKTIPFPLEFVIANRPPRGEWYEIPYRCLLPVEVRGLLVAGRCISSDRPAQGSLRIMPTCMFTGAAAGTAAALAAAGGIAPHDVDASEVRARVQRRALSCR